MASASTSCDIRIPADTIPTVQTKVKLANSILISPLGEFDHI